MPVIKVDNDRRNDKWIMPDGLPNELEDVKTFDYEGIQALSAAVVKDAYDELCDAYYHIRRKSWERRPEGYSIRKCKQNVLQAEAFMFESLFVEIFPTLNPRYLVMQARKQVFGNKWREHWYFIQRKHNNDIKRKREAEKRGNEQEGPLSQSPRKG